MTEEQAAKLSLEDKPRLHLRALLELVRLLQKSLEPVGRQGNILPSDQTKEDAHGNQTTPAITITQPKTKKTTFTPRRPKKRRRAHGSNATANAQKRHSQKRGGQ
jgi:hypothetical protein